MRVLIVALMVMVCGSAVAKTHTVVVVETQNGKTVDVRPGDDVQVTFVASGATGYAWEMEPVTSTVLTVGKRDSIVQKPGLAGGPVTTVFHVSMTKKGEETVRFKFYRAWMKDLPPDKVYVVTLKAR